MTDKIVYKADIETNDGISETEFTSKYNNHTMSFRNRERENDSKLPKFIWSLTDQNKELVLNGPFLKNLLDQNCAIYASLKN